MAAVQEPRLLFLDGAMGTYLEDHHQITFDNTKPGWSSNVDPVVIGHVHDEYAESADVLLSATYQGTLQNMAPADRNISGVDGKDIAHEKIHELVDVCKVAAAVSNTHPARAVALSLGPYGATMIPSTEYSGRYPATMSDVHSLSNWHLERLRDYVIAPGTSSEHTGLGTSSAVSRAWKCIEYVAFETLVSSTEVMAVIDAMSKLGVAAGRKPYWASVNYPNGTLDEPLTPSMETAEDIGNAALSALDEQLDLWGLGVNCTKIDKVDAVVQGYEKSMQAQPHTSRPFLVLYPDGATNLKYNTETKTWDPISDQDITSASWAVQMEALLRKIMARGRWPGILVGGCCKTSPDDITALRQRMADL